MVRRQRGDTSDHRKACAHRAFSVIFVRSRITKIHNDLISYGFSNEAIIRRYQPADTIVIARRNFHEFFGILILPSCTRRSKLADHDR